MKVRQKMRMKGRGDIDVVVEDGIGCTQLSWTRENISSLAIAVLKLCG